MSYKFLILFFVFLGFALKTNSQNIIEKYSSKKNDSIQISKTNKDFLPYIQKGFTLLLPEGKKINGVIIFLEDSGYDKKNKSSKQLYKQASKNNLAVLSVSSEIPFDFYFFKKSVIETHKIIESVFKKYNLPNKNIFFIGVGLSGHRVMKYIEFMKKDNYAFQLNIKGVVVCNSVLDWVSEWYKFDREKITFIYDRKQKILHFSNNFIYNSIR